MNKLLLFRCCFCNSGFTSCSISWEECYDAGSPLIAGLSETSRRDLRMRLEAGVEFRVDISETTCQ
uniref:Secreted protein n=1 Tax=Heterorhabditis bacteriophora TaxID=37862 RepID=A0A1I7XAY3_HETBA